MGNVPSADNLLIEAVFVIKEEEPSEAGTCVGTVSLGELPDLTLFAGAWAGEQSGGEATSGMPVVVNPRGKKPHTSQDLGRPVKPKGIGPKTLRVQRKALRTTRSVQEKLKLEKAMKDMDLLKCHVCSAKQDDLKALSQHYKLAHKRLVRIVCCKNSFPIKRAFDHIEFHLNPDAFKCNECDKRFINPGNLKKHNLVYHLSERPKEDAKTFPGTYCGGTKGTSNSPINSL